jgi:hypothetical protein
METPPCATIPERRAGETPGVARGRKRHRPGFENALGSAPYRWEVERAPTVEDAIALAAQAHRGQHYSSPEAEPYIFIP